MKLLTNDDLQYMGQDWLVWGKGDIKGIVMEQSLYVCSLRKKCKLDEDSFLCTLTSFVRHFEQKSIMEFNALLCCLQHTVHVWSMKSCDNLNNCLHGAILKIDLVDTVVNKRYENPGLFSWALFKWLIGIHFWHVKS